MSPCGRPAPRIRPAVVAGAFFALAVPAAAGQTIDLRHEALDCAARGAYPVVDAAIRASDEIRTAKVYFRADVYPDFYYVEMRRVDGVYVGVLPQPGPETQRIVYYIEALDAGFASARDVEHDPEVRIRCDNDDRSFYVPGDDPAIVVGATAEGASPLPPGFSAAGIAGFLTSTGVSSAGGAGVGTAVAVGAAVAGGVAGTVAAAGGGGDDAERPSGPRSEPGAPPPPGGSTGPPPPPSPTSTTSTTTSTTSTTPTTTTTTSAPVTTACFTATLIDECRVRFDASCSKNALAFAWVLDAKGAAKGPFARSGMVVTKNFEDCKGQVVVNELTVKGPAGSAMTSSSFKLPDDLTAWSDPVLASRFTTLPELSTPSGGELAGFLVIGGARIPVVNQGAATVDFTARPPEILVEVTPAAGARGLWRFDFSQSAHVVPGSLRPELGHVAARSGAAIAFRLAGEPGERIRFRVRLSR